MNNNQIIDKVNNLIGDKGKLLYLTLFGSHLYGTNTPESDHDYKGIYLPSLDNFYSWQNPKSINVSTGNSNSKNSKDDIDIELYSLPYFIHKLLSAGDTSALDILYSVNNKEAVIYGYEDMCMIKGNITKILNIKTTNAYIGYSLGQAKKYGIKGTRLGVLKNIKGYLDKNLHYGDNIKLYDISDAILENFYDKSYCFSKIDSNKGSNNEYLCICGSMHQINITVPEFRERIDKAIESYGNRTQKALEEGYDWKSLSHAVRVLYQCIDLYLNGNISFPLNEQSRKEVLSIKNGEKEYEEVENLILYLLEKVDKYREACTLDWKYNNEHCIRLVRYFYKEYIL